MPLEAPVIATTFKDFVMQLWAFGFPVHGIINEQREQGRHEDDDEERYDIDARIRAPSGQGVRAVAVDLLRGEHGESIGKPAGTFEKERGCQRVDDDEGTMKGHELRIATRKQQAIQMENCGNQKERRAYGKNGLPVELHLITVGFEKRRPAPAEFAVRVFPDLLMHRAVIADCGEILREALAGDFERTEI